MIWSNSEKLGWVVPFSSGFAVHMLSVAKPQGWDLGSVKGPAPGPEVYTSSHLSTHLLFTQASVHLGNISLQTRCGTLFSCL